MSLDDSDSDSDNEEEIQVKKYLLNDFKEHIQLARINLQNSTKLGIKRQPGHHHLRDSGHAVLPERKPYYEGTHWDVEVVSRLQRSTPRLTRYAIKRVILEEQNGRAKNKDRFLDAKNALKNLNEEFDKVIVYNYGRIGIEREKEHSRVQQNKERVHWELLRKAFGKQADAEQEQERQYRIKVLKGLSDKSKRTPSIEDLVCDMAETNYKRAMVNRDLEEAQANLEEKTNAVENEYKAAMSEMLDESLAKVVHTFAKDETKLLSEQEKLRRMSKQTVNGNPSKEYKVVKNALSELKQAFKVVDEEEALKEEKYKEKVADMKAVMQEQLVRCVTKKQTDKAIAEERARRIKESEQNARDPTQNAMRHLVTRVQRQMLLQKFKGKWINLVKKPKDEVETTAKENETEVDRKLRQLREGQRRALCVMRGDDVDE